MTSYRQRPDWLRRLNDFGPATAASRSIVPLDPSELLASARETTGLQEIGDPNWIETFERRIRSIDEESNANLLGRFLARAETIRVLQTKLRLHEAWAREPAILAPMADHPTRRPDLPPASPLVNIILCIQLLLQLIEIIPDTIF